MLYRLELRPPKKNARFIAHHGRLALFHRVDDAHRYWSEYWLNEHGANRLSRAATGVLDAGFDVFFELLKRYVPKGASVLEAGCGPGHVVACLGARGYDAIGVDYVPTVVSFAKAILPTLDVRVADVEDLPFPDGSFDCYASLGVVEHFEAGAERAIAEASRVVRRGGIAIVEVPFLNQLRQNHLRHLRPSERHPDLTFHQYYYSDAELSSVFQRNSFVVLERVPNCWEGVLFREHALLAPFLESPLAVHRVRTAVRRLVASMPRAGRFRYAHTMAFACRRQ